MKAEAIDVEREPAVCCSDVRNSGNFILYSQVLPPVGELMYQRFLVIESTYFGTFGQVLAGRVKL